MATPSEPIVFVVAGQAQSLETALLPGATRGAPGPSHQPEWPRGRLKHSVRVGIERAGAAAPLRISAVPGEDVVVLHIAGGPALTLHPETARDLLLAQGDRKRGGGTRGAAPPAPNEVQVPVQLQWRGLEQAALRGAHRGLLGDVLLSAIDVVTGLAKDAAADFAASQVVQRVDAQVEDGVYRLNAEAIDKLKGSSARVATRIGAEPDGAALLVFVHGTFSETHGTFGKLWTQHPRRVRQLFERYANRVYALDHATLGKSPIDNALTLVQALPDGARLHLVTHSRGGLVAEALARVCADPTAIDDELFDGDAHRPQRAALKELAALVKARGIRVDRVVRVACPARGTLLASKRLDAYLSVFKWTLDLAGVPVAPALVDFLAEVARRRADPEMIPGLAAQIPDSPLVQWLHAVDDAIPGDLRVVAGDMEGDSVTSWLKTLLADAFYWTDNDLVVQTRSMYGGAPRAAGASFVLDQGGTVSHFSYFANERTAEAIVNAITQDTPHGFRVIGPLSWAGESSGGIRGVTRGSDDGRPASDKPAVFVLPGILGSNLKVDGKRIWLGWRLVNGLKRLDYQPGRPDGVEPDGPIGMFYDDLGEYLARTHEVIEFAFDWRVPIEQEARRLADAVEAALAARDASGQPVRIVAHSLGGVVARTLQLERPDVWQRLMARPGARVLMLGTPNAGSWAPMQVLSGDDTFGNTLVAFGAPFQDHAARQVMARFPGFIQLQAQLLDAALGLDRQHNWQTLADQDLERVREHNWWHADERQLNAYKWGVPPQAVLDQAVALRKRLDAQRDHDLPAFKDQLLLVVGHAPFTPDGYELGSDGLLYLDAPEAGDGRVTRASAMLPGVRTWQLDCEHRDLPDEKDAFEAYLELLQTGSTNRLAMVSGTAPTRAGTVPAPIAHVRSRPSRLPSVVRPPETPRDVVGLEGRELPVASAATGTPLSISVVNGDLRFVRQPLVIGHYQSMRLTGTEAVMNRLIGGAMEQALKIGLYPEAPGTHQVFVNTRADPDNPWRLPRPEAVIVAGLGEEGKLRASDLVQTVRQAVIAWAQRAAEGPSGAPAVFELAATLIGSGGTGITPGQSAQLVAQGVREASQRLAESGWPRVSRLYVIELYLDRASDAWRALHVQATATPGHFHVSPTVLGASGALRRPLTSGYRGADHDFISALTQRQANGDAAIVYTLDTKRARTEVRAQATQGRLLRELVARASNDRADDAQIGRTLFQLLVPVEMEPFLGGTTEMLIELDSGTAGIPWEMLDAQARGGGDTRPWAIRAKLLRKLRTSQFRAQVVDANPDASVLVIGEPQCEPPYARLPGARAEANAVAQRLKAPGALGADRVKELISPDDELLFGADARTVVSALLERDWRIVHIAGHGEPPELIGPVPSSPGDAPQTLGDPRGVVLSNHTFLGPREIRNMRVVPQLVFVNCCHLAATERAQLLRGEMNECAPRYDRAQFAASVAEELIQTGVRCVIAAGWAVDDRAAMSFATRFYDALLRGARFIDAVAQARDAAREHGGNTWAAYQCYGDPDWCFEREGADAQHPSRPMADEFAVVASPPALALALETLAVQSKYLRTKGETEDLRAKIRHLEARFELSWGSIGAVAEAFGVAWTAARDVARAIRWYERALEANDGSASLKAAEQLGNLRVRSAWESVAGLLDDGGAALRDALPAARGTIEAALEALERIVAVAPSIERESLCGSACKRLAMVHAQAGDTRAEEQALARMQMHYERAEQMAREQNHPERYYPALNRMAVELTVNAGRRGWQGFEADALEAVRQSLVDRARDDPDFWSVVSLIELRVYEALARGELGTRLDSIANEYDDLHTRVTASWMWSSVGDQAQFVLPKVAAHAPPAEKKAALALLKRLQRFAQG